MTGQGRRLVALLLLERDIEVVAQLGRGDHVLDTAILTRLDVAVLDIDPPGADGLTVDRHLHDMLLTCPVLVLTGLSQPGTSCAPRSSTSAVSSSRTPSPTPSPTSSHPRRSAGPGSGSVVDL
ncbi:MAG TPA: hypothetical protein VHK88_00205, partial [Aquihabitans sp.]|nr:hypothetical protein [Aquihabitans sp.]